MKRLVETQTIKSAMNDMSPIQKHTSLTQAFKVWSMDNCSLHEERHGKSCHVLRQPQFAAQCLLTRGVRPESSLGQLSIGGGGSVLLRMSCASAAAQLKHLNNTTTLVNLLLIVRIFF